MLIIRELHLRSQDIGSGAKSGLGLGIGVFQTHFQVTHHYLRNGNSQIGHCRRRL
jgi:hypothetical protein